MLPNTYNRSSEEIKTKAHRYAGNLRRLPGLTSIQRLTIFDTSVMPAAVSNNCECVAGRASCRCFHQSLAPIDRSDVQQIIFQHCVMISTGPQPGEHIARQSKGCNLTNQASISIRQGY